MVSFALNIYKFYMTQFRELVEDHGLHFTAKLYIMYLIVV